MNNKRGSSSVFLMFILAAVIGVTAMFIYAAKQTAYTGIGDGALNLSMRSILSEFDLALKERYGLMAFEKNGMEAALEINDYVDYMFNDKNPVKEIEVTFGNYPLSNVNTLKKQIIEYMEMAVAEEMPGDESTDFERYDVTDRTLRNEAVIRNLPSNPFAEDGSGFLKRLEQWKDKLDSIEAVFDDTTQSYMLNLYIMKHFKYATGGPVKEESFFSHEVEYIIAGDKSNLKNRKTIEKGLKILRTAFNAAFIYADEMKRAQTLAAAELLTPEAAPATQAVLVTTWAAAEADNDVKLLLKGRPVPLMKDDASWATDLDNILDNITEDCIDTGNQKGLYYSDYMMIFLHFQDEEMKLARAADLIQINMKGTYNRDFLMKTAKGGFYLNSKIYGKDMEYETCY